MTAILKHNDKVWGGCACPYLTRRIPIIEQSGCWISSPHTFWKFCNRHRS